MPRAWYNHVTVHATDVPESTQFYADLFGAEPLPMPNMGAPIQWLKIGDLQLHIGDLQHDLHGDSRPDQVAPALSAQHFALTVEDFVEVYRLVQERNIPEDDMIWGHALNVLPNGQLQYYIRDPSGNLIEIDFPDASSLPDDIRERTNDQSERFKQSEEQRKAGLSLEQREGEASKA